MIGNYYPILMTIRKETIMDIVKAQFHYSTPFCIASLGLGTQTEVIQGLFFKKVGNQGGFRKKKNNAWYKILQKLRVCAIDSTQNSGQFPHGGALQKNFKKIKN